jgi:predicted acetyltransferase
MNVQLEPVGPETRAALEALFQLYVYDFTEMTGEDVAEDGRFAAPPLDELSSDPRFLPFLLRADGKLAGLAIVRRGSRLTGDAGTWDMAQFFVMRRYRRQAVGARAAHQLFAAHPGPWEVRQIPENSDGTAFWRRVIDDFAGPGGWAETRMDGEGWRGTVQRFTSPPAG